MHTRNICIEDIGRWKTTNRTHHFIDQTIIEKIIVKLINSKCYRPIKYINMVIRKTEGSNCVMETEITCFFLAQRTYILCVSEVKTKLVLSIMYNTNYCLDINVYFLAFNRIKTC